MWDLGDCVSKKGKHGSQVYFQIAIWSQGKGLVTKKELATEKYSQTGRVGVDATDLLVFTKVLLTVGIQGLGWS